MKETDKKVGWVATFGDGRQIVVEPRYRDVPLSILSMSEVMRAPIMWDVSSHLG
jgi:hypothetical protein